MSEDNDNYYPEKEDDNSGALIPLLILGIGGALVLATSGHTTTPPPVVKKIVLSGSTVCNIGQTQAEVNLSWVSDTGDTDYDIIRDGSSVDSVHGSLTWKAYMPTLQQGQSHQWKIIGVPSQKISNIVTVITATCGNPIPDAQVASLDAEFS